MNIQVILSIDISNITLLQYQRPLFPLSQLKQPVHCYLPLIMGIKRLPLFLHEREAENARR